MQYIIRKVQSIEARTQSSEWKLENLIGMIIASNGGERLPIGDDSGVNDYLIP